MRQMMVLAFFGLAVGAGAIAHAAPDTAAERAALQKCLASKGWCLAVATDRISLNKSPYGLLPAQQPIVAHRSQNRLAWNVTCDDAGHLTVFLMAAGVLTYGDIGIRYRVDPAGITGNAAAVNTGNGKMFLAEPAARIVEAMKLGGTLTVALDWRTETAIVTFGIAGVDAVLRHINCGPR